MTPSSPAGRTENNDVVVAMRGITMRFPGVLANENVDFDIRRGEIHALLGENGAGKSTLMNVLTGLYAPSEGEIEINGRVTDFRSPKDAIAAGIGMVHQHFMLVEPHTVTENVILGLSEPRFRIDMAKAEQDVLDISSQYGLQVDPQAYIWQMSVGEQQRVEVIKALYRGAQILILDEPTAVLTPQETEELFVTLRNMVDKEHSIVFISHKLDEVMAIADRVSILRGGKMVRTEDAADTNKVECAEWMVGRPVLFRLNRPDVTPGEPVLHVENLGAENDKGLPALQNVSFDVRSHEIVGVAGVSGNGQVELAEALNGLRPITSGHIELQSQDITTFSARDIIDAGVAHVPEDRHVEGSVGTMGLTENIILKNYRRPPVARGALIDWKKAASLAAELVERFDVKAPGLHTNAASLSGGNLQKLILARELSTEPTLIVAVHPTQGLDIGATESVRELLIEQRTQGAGVLLISEDLDEVMQISDRILVLYEGQIMGEVYAEQADRGEIGLMMAGQRQKVEHAGA